MNTRHNQVALVFAHALLLSWCQANSSYRVIDMEDYYGNTNTEKCTYGDQALTWWRHQMETFSAWLALCEGNPPVSGGFTSQRPVTRSFDIFIDQRLNKRMSKPSRRRWLETPSSSSWSHCNDVHVYTFWTGSSLVQITAWTWINAEPLSINLSVTNFYQISI